MDQVREGYRRQYQSWQGSQRRRGVGIEGTVGALVGATHLADAENVERRGVESCDKESFWSQRFYNDCLSSSRQVCHWEIPRRKIIFRIHNVMVYRISIGCHYRKN